MGGLLSGHLQARAVTGALTIPHIESTGSAAHVLQHSAKHTLLAQALLPCAVTCHPRNEIWPHQEATRDTSRALQVLYPLFVYSYLDTVKQRQALRAQEMMRHVKPRFLECDGASPSLAKELEDLATVLYPQHLQNPVPKAVRTSCPEPPVCAAGR